jgi:predicted enzyme related to lactoylglutathione lyase
MSTTIETVTVDCARPWQLAEFWSALLDWPIDGDNGPDDEEVAVSPRVAGPTPLLFLRVPDVKTVKNRIHLDLRPQDQAAEVERALSLGATRSQIGQTGDESWVVLADPEGNEFCILRAL